MLNTLLIKLTSGEDGSLNQNNNGAILRSCCLSIVHDKAPFPFAHVPLPLNYHANKEQNKRDKENFFTLQNLHIFNSPFRPCTNP